MQAILPFYQPAPLVQAQPILRNEASFIQSPFVRPISPSPLRVMNLPPVNPIPRVPRPITPSPVKLIQQTPRSYSPMPVQIPQINQIKKIN